MDKESKIACCSICLLSDVMKRCKTCPFNPAYVNMDQNKAQAQIKAELQKELKSNETKQI